MEPAKKLTNAGELERKRIGLMKREIRVGYDAGSCLMEMLNCESVEHADKSFTKIERKVVLERTWFTDPLLEPRFSSIGRAIQNAELVHVLGKLQRSIETIALKSSDLSRDWLQSVVNSVRSEKGRISILSSSDNNFKVFDVAKDARRKKWNPEIKLGNLRVTLRNLYGLDEIVENNLVVANSESCLLQHQLFHYESRYPSERESNLHIEIKPEKDQTKMGIQAYSMMKLTILNDNLVKIISVEE